MSYEGRVEFLCHKGHYTSVECYENEPGECRCGAKMRYRHSIDDTNGEIDGDPHTRPAPVINDDFDDVWKEDHYGNRYAVALPRFLPGEHWDEIAIDTEIGDKPCTNM